MSFFDGVILTPNFRTWTMVVFDHELSLETEIGQ